MFCGRNTEQGEKKVDQFMKKWVPTIVTLALTMIGMFDGPIKVALSAHPALGLAIAGVYAILKGLAPSPVMVDQGGK